MLERQIDFAKYSSIKLGTKLNIKIAQDIDEALNLATNHYLIGKVNNIILHSDGIRIFQLGSEFDYIKDLGDLVEIGARSVSKKVFLYFKKNNLGGVEFLGSLPGTMGGIAKMNAGMKEYEIKNIIHSICINGEWQNNEKINFQYRNSNINGVISALRLKKIDGFDSNLENLFKAMRLNQPKEPSCGSCFKNPPNIPAGKLLDLAGLKGHRIGNMAFSQKHANFLINLGSGKSKDAIDLINMAKSTILKSHNIMLECEVVII
ncbi:MAG: UDP-N-acetylmuramate dehydrogenase [Helicobacteraceae bacterium]|nr:UDP-N-acetylmuramate dehydrogenase [Helicobacteraceae bacterium]